MNTVFYNEVVDELARHPDLESQLDQLAQDLYAEVDARVFQFREECLRELNTKIIEYASFLLELRKPPVASTKKKTITFAKTPDLTSC